MSILDMLLGGQQGQPSMMTPEQISASNLAGNPLQKRELTQEELDQMMKARNFQANAQRTAANNTGMQYAQNKDVTGEAMGSLSGLMGMMGKQQREPNRFQPTQMPMHQGILNLLGG